MDAKGVCFLLLGPGPHRSCEVTLLSLELDLNPLRFLVDGIVFHPGDALTLPMRPVDTLLLPVHAPWCKLAEVIDYVRAVKPRRAFPIHDGLPNDFGRALVDRLLGESEPGIGPEYRRVANAETVERE
jgi:hypothetical protein